MMMVSPWRYPITMCPEAHPQPTCRLRSQRSTCCCTLHGPCGFVCEVFVITQDQLSTVVASHVRHNASQRYFESLLTL